MDGVWVSLGSGPLPYGSEKVKFKNLDEKMVRRLGMILTAGFLLAALSEVFGGMENGILKIARNKPGEEARKKNFLSMQEKSLKIILLSWKYRNVN